MAVMPKKRVSHKWTATKVRKLRERLDLSQRAAAELVGVTRRQWAAWEAGESTPSGPAAMLLTLLDQRDGKI